MTALPAGEIAEAPTQGLTRSRAGATRRPGIPARDAGLGDRAEPPDVLLGELTDRTEQRLATAVVGISVLLFIAAAPFARVPLAQVPAFIPAYEAALITMDLITALLLFGQYQPVRRRRRRSHSGQSRIGEMSLAARSKTCCSKARM